MKYPRLNRPLLISLALGHMCIDSLATFILPLFPVLEATHGLSEYKMGVLMLCTLLTTSFAQPLWGYVSDRWRRSVLVSCGPLLALIPAGMIGLAPNYGVLLVLVLVIGLGVSSFHPAAATLATWSSGKRPVLGMGFFIVSGHLGLGLGPLLAGWLAETHGLGSTWWIIPPGLVIVGLLAIAHRRHDVAMPRRPLVPLRKILAGHGRLVGLLLLLSSMRAMVGISIVQGIPFCWSSYGLGESRIGLFTGVFLFAGGIAGFVVSIFIRPGREKPWIVGSIVAAMPVIYFLPVQHTEGRILLFAFLGGAFLNATIPAVLVLAQRCLKGGEGMASALILGVAWGLGGSLTSLFLRRLQGLFGEAQVLQVFTVALIPALICAMLLPGREKA